MTSLARHPSVLLLTLGLCGLTTASSAFADRGADAGGEESPVVPEDADIDKLEPLPTDRSDEEIVRRYAEVAPLIECETYEMAEYSRSYLTPYVDDTFAWGHHAMQWKAFRVDTWTAGDGRFSASQADAQTAMPTYDLECGDHSTLDGVEDDSWPAFWDEPTYTNAIDPAGTWICNTDNDSENGAIIAALGMYYWQSPTYLDVHGYDTVNNEYMVQGVIEKVTLCNTGTDEPHEACGWDVSSPTAALANIGACAGTLVLDSVEISYWHDILVGGGSAGIIEHVTFTGADWANVYGSWGTDDVDLITDPPEGTEDSDLSALFEVAAGAAEGLLVLEDGALVDAETGEPAGGGAGGK